jgi:hypothetical protein
MKENQQVSSATNECKKPYHKPQLQVYGDLKDITQAVAVSGALDGVLVLRTH